MDQNDLPTADELGVTEIEYERILRGLRQREQDGLRAPADARDLVEQDGMIAYQGSTEQRVTEVPEASQPFRFRKRWALALLVVLIPVVVSRTGSGAQGPGYAFEASYQGRPVTYSSCKQIRVEVYPAGGPSNAEALVREAVGELRSATGLDIVVTGVFGGHAANWNFHSSDALRSDDPVSVSWQDSSAIKDLSGDIAGLGGSAVFTRTADGSEVLGAGAIALSRELYTTWARDKNHGKEIATLLHEFGHVVGLAHVDSPDELMYPSLTDRTSYGTGDLAGLRKAGHGPCY